jgi:hypothetical protein
MHGRHDMPGRTEEIIACFKTRHFGAGLLAFTEVAGKMARLLQQDHSIGKRFFPESG